MPQKILIIRNDLLRSSVIPAKAGIHNLLIFLDSRIRGNDGLTTTIFI